MIDNRMWLKLICLNKHRNKETHPGKHREIISATEVPGKRWPNQDGFVISGMIIWLSSHVCAFNLLSYGSDLDNFYKIPTFFIHLINTVLWVFFS